jgi:hypothetical protein
MSTLRGLGPCTGTAQQGAGTNVSEFAQPTLCPVRKTADSQAAELTDEELNTICLDTARLKVIRSR